MMIGQLPTTLNVNETDYPIRYDYRTALVIFQAYDDPNLTPYEKERVMLECLYEIVPSNKVEAAKQAVWFLDGGSRVESPNERTEKKILDWEQDEQMVFSALNKVAGREIRNDVNMHLWTFLGLFSEIEEGLLSNVLHIRTKLNKHIRLEKHEREFYRRNRALIDIQPKLSDKEKKRREAEKEAINELLGRKEGEA